MSAGGPEVADLAFTKMHGLGNDFMVVENLAGRHRFDPGRIRRLADRHTGVGFDQLLVVEPPRHAGSAFTYRIYNADGEEVEHCGNGARCFARFVHDRGLDTGGCVRVDTMVGTIELQRLDDGQVRVLMGIPVFAPREVPFDAPADRVFHELDAGGRRWQVGVVSIGNPHVLLRVDDLARAPVATLGAEIESHPRFPRRVNVGFAEVRDRRHMALRVFERGVGETRACGSGACAAVVIAHRQGLVERCCTVTLPGGDLVVDWSGDDMPVALTGPCSTVYEGRIRT